MCTFLSDYRCERLALPTYRRHARSANHYGQAQGIVSAFMTATYLQGLNKPQTEAVLYDDGPLLVEAGPGSGKTRMLTCRIARLIDTGISPRRILAITFTNKAAEEMHSRLEQLLPGQAASRVSASTFHSACVKVLRSDIGLVRPHDTFDIIDASDTTRLLRSVIEDIGGDPEKYPPTRAKALISAAKNSNRVPGDLEREAKVRRSENRTLADEMEFCAAVYREYERRMVKNAHVDFDDLLVLTLRLLANHSEALDKWRDRYDHLLVDEYQDTNLVQNEIAILLTAKNRQITAVGDSDQGIYSFRGADTRNILQLQDHFEGLRVVHLGRNYRSTGNIVEAASAVIANNNARRDKRLWTKRPQGEPVVLFDAADEEDEAEWVVDGIIARERSGETEWPDTAVLFRVNAQSRPLEHSLSEANVPYKLVSGPSFYERREVVDALSYLRVALDPTDTDSVRRALRSPSRGVGAKTMAKIEGHARTNGLTLMGALRQHRRIRLWSVAAKGVAEFVETIEAVSCASSPEKALHEATERSGIRARLRAEGTDEALDRLANLDELIGAAAEHDSVDEFLAEVAEVVASGDRGSRGPAVTLSTLHSAKGLEFKDVYMVGVEEGLLPHRHSMGDSAKVEEERRLAYVGMTRAMDRLALSCAQSRRLYNNEAENPPSRFLGEVPSHLLRRS